jgi:hypothetical protein
VALVHAASKVNAIISNGLFDRVAEEVETRQAAERVVRFHE